MAEPPYLTPLQQALAIAGALALFALIVVLIYRRRLREDYGALWFTIGLVLVLFAAWQDGLRLIARALDAVTLTAPLFLLSILFLTGLAITFSVRLTDLSRKVTALARELALLRGEADGPGDGPRAPSAR
jgi:hypothetical protein